MSNTDSTKRKQVTLDPEAINQGIQLVSLRNLRGNFSLLLEQLIREEHARLVAAGKITDNNQQGVAA